MFKKGKSAVFRTVIQAPAKEGLHTLTATLKKDGIVKKKELKLACSTDDYLSGNYEEKVPAPPEPERKELYLQVSFSLQS